MLVFVPLDNVLAGSRIFQLAHWVHKTVPIHNASLGTPECLQFTTSAYVLHQAIQHLQQPPATYDLTADTLKFLRRATRWRNVESDVVLCPTRRLQDCRSKKKSQSVTAAHHRER